MLKSTGIFVAAVFLAQAAGAADVKSAAGSPFGELKLGQAGQKASAPLQDRGTVESGLDGSFVSDKSYTDLRLLTMDMLAKEAELRNSGMKIVSSEKVQSGVNEYFFIIKYEIPMAARAKIFTSVPLGSTEVVKAALENAVKVLGELVPPVQILESAQNANNSFTIKYYSPAVLKVVEYKSPRITYRSDPDIKRDLAADLTAAVENAGGRVLFASWSSFGRESTLTLAYVGDISITHKTTSVWTWNAPAYINSSTAVASASGLMVATTNNYIYVYDFYVSKTAPAPKP